MRTAVFLASLLVASAANEFVANAPPSISLQEALARAGYLRQRGDVLGAVTILEAGARDKTGGASAVADASALAMRGKLLTELADAYGSIKQHDKAAATRREAIATSLKASGGRTTVADLVTAQVQLAQDLRDAGRYDEALAIVHKAQGTEGVSSNAATQAVLVQFESSLLDCKGEPLLALQAYEASRGLRRNAAGTQQQPDDPTNDILQHIDLLRRVLHTVDTAAAAAAVKALPAVQGVAGLADSSGSSAAVAVSASGATDANTIPPAVVDTMRQQLAAEVGRLLARGPYARPEQLPATYIPGLPAQPWWEAATSYPFLLPVIDLLRNATKSLRGEYKQLKAAGRLHRETECIHDAASGGWSWYATNGYWTPRDPATGCSLHTPAACALLDRIAALGIENLTVMRGSYSAIDQKAYLRPHCGRTNGQLKMHLGLIVPRTAAGSPCAALTVGNETRAWSEGGVLFFDDSFLHSVRNECSKERVIFQFVFAHPDLDPAKHGAAATKQLPGH